MTSTSNPQSELHRLQELQSSLKTIETRIQYLVKEQLKTQKTVQKTLKSSIAKIGHKASQAKFHQQMRALHEKENMNRSALHTSILEYKQKQKQDISSIKQNILAMKKSQSLTLKQISKKNEEIIREGRKKQVQTKKSTIEQIRFLRNQTKKELERKKEEEEKEQLRKREEEIGERLKQKEMIQNKITELLGLEGKLVTKIEESQKTVQTLREVVNESIQIPKEEFYKIIKEVKKEKGKGVGDEGINQAVFDKFMKMKAERQSTEGTKRVNDGLGSGGRMATDINEGKTH